MAKSSISPFSKAASVVVGLLLSAVPLVAAPIPIVNGDFELPVLPDVTNNSFDGVHGPGGVVPGWWSNQPSFGGVEHVSWRQPGRTGNNVMYLHGDANQTFYTKDFDLGVNLQSNTKYTLSFDALRWAFTQNDLVIFSAGVYTGSDYESRSALVEISGDFYLLDGDDNPVDARTFVLTFTTAEVANDTKFWIGGSSFGNGLDAHKTHFDQFSLDAEAIPEPSSFVLLSVLGAAAIGIRRFRTGRI